ncbi:UNVERIFIED_CONTAM: hypothetical protein FKN15_062841 [Acipenser sinensis]
MATASTSRVYDLVIFGASGFTGQFVVEEVARNSAEGPKGTLKWAVAGRNHQKLQQVLDQAAGNLGKPELKSEVDIIIADVEDPDSLASMSKQAAIVLNCVGPSLQQLRQRVAVHGPVSDTTCGKVVGTGTGVAVMRCRSNRQTNGIPVQKVFNCFPGLVTAKRINPRRYTPMRTLTAIESFLSVNAGPEGGSIHDGTWQSAVYGFADQDKLRSLRKKLGHKPLPVVGAKLKRRGAVFYSDEVKQYAVPFMGSDPSVVKRTQRYLCEELEESPVQYSAFAAVGGVCSVIKLMFAVMLFWLFVLTSFGRNLLIKGGSVYSWGRLLQD